MAKRIYEEIVTLVAENNLAMKHHRRCQHKRKAFSIELRNLLETPTAPSKGPLSDWVGHHPTDKSVKVSGKVWALAPVALALRKHARTPRVVCVF